MVRSPRFFYFSVKQKLIFPGQLKGLKPIFHDEAMGKRSRFTLAYVTTVMLIDQKSHLEILFREFTMFHQ